MTTISTEDLTPASIGQMAPLDVDQVYNGLDCCVTFEVWEALRSLQNQDSLIYNFERALQGPVLEMMLRGFNINQHERQESVRQTSETLGRLNNILQQYAHAVWDKPLNPNSTQQLQKFFYGTMGLPEQWTSKKGKRSLAMDRDALEKLESYHLAMPIVATILAMRDHAKRLQVFTTEIDSDGRYRTSFNIAGTETGRFSSSKSSTGTGGNAQNISPAQRRMFEADQGFRLFGIDLEQAESREVGWNCGTLFGDWQYYDAAIAGDLHTTASKLIWPDLGWTGDPKRDRAVAEQTFYRHFSYRDMAKRGGHGCLTEDHEVLTPEGWVPIAQKPPVIMTYRHGRTITPKSQWATVSHWTDYNHGGPLHEWHGRHLSVCMTPDHKVPAVRLTNSSKLACEGPPPAIPLGQGWNPTHMGKPIPAAMMALLHCSYKPTDDGVVPQVLEIRCQSKRRHERTLAVLANHQIETIHGPMGGKWSIQIDTSQPTWQALRIDPSHFTMGYWQLEWPAQTINTYFDTMGFLRPWNTRDLSFYLSPWQDIPLLTTLARLIGLRTSVQSSAVGTVTATIAKRLTATGIDLTCVKHPPAERRVLCPTVPTGYFYIRRHGRISVTGNSNYYGQPYTMARHLKVPKKLMVDFQLRYFDAFPIPKWHQWVSQQLQTTQRLVTKFGRERYFFGRPNDDTTLREAIAFDPQSCTADRTNLILWRLWHYMGDRIQLLTQEHDAIYFQASMDLDPEGLAAEALSHFSIPFQHSGRTLLVPGEVKVGWNKANYVGLEDVEKARLRSGQVPILNTDGLRKLKGPDTRNRTSSSVWDRTFSGGTSSFPALRAMA